MMIDAPKPTPPSERRPDPPPAPPGPPPSVETLKAEIDELRADFLRVMNKRSAEWVHSYETFTTIRGICTLDNESMHERLKRIWRLMNTVLGPADATIAAGERMKAQWALEREREQEAEQKQGDPK